MGIGDLDILDLYEQRKMDRADALRRKKLARDVYENKLKVNLSELDRLEMPAVANLMSQGVDAIGQRIASVLPSNIFPVMKEGIKRSIQEAQDRKAVIDYWFEEDRIDLIISRSARWYATYAASYTMVKPNQTKQCPQRYLRDPLTSFPDNCSMVGDPACGDCIFSYERPWAWLARNYPAAKSQLARAKNTPQNERFTIVEWVDDTEWVMLACGKPQPQPQLQQSGFLPIMRLEQVYHRAGQCPVSAAGRITLDAEVGQFDGMIGMYWQQAMLMALEVIAVKKGIFPDTWWIGRQGMTPKILRDADGLRGITGLAQDADPYTSNEQPGYKTDTTMDRLERAQRLDARIPAEFGGESGSNIRTGRRGDAVLAAVVDFPVQEAQRVFSRSLQHENLIGIELDKAWWGNKTKTIWMGTRPTTYTPNALWTETYHRVSYSHAGADANTLALGVLQRVGAGTMADITAMELDPLVADAQHEKSRVDIMGLEKALLASIQNLASQGTIPPGDLARIIQLRTNDTPLADAIAAAQKEAQARQATPAPPESPATQPGLAPPGAGAEQPSIPTAPQGGQNLAGLLRNLAAGSRAASAPPQGAPA